jgi:putative resolvase
MEVGQVVAKAGSDLNGKRPKLTRILSDPCATVIVMEHRDRLARFGVEHVQAALAAQDRRIMIIDNGESSDGLVREMFEVVTGMCVGLHRRGPPNRAMRVVTAAEHPEPATAG